MARQMMDLKAIRKPTELIYSPNNSISETSPIISEDRRFRPHSHTLSPITSLRATTGMRH